MSVAVSIIVPIYNVERYLKQCIESLINQSLSNIEIILVDDGSPDNSGIIADEYVKKDSRIKVIHQNNHGLGPARNSGLKIAKGEYVGFVDSDDYVKPNMYKDLYNKAKEGNYDFVGGKYSEVNGNLEHCIHHPLAGKEFTDKTVISSLRKRYYGHLYKIDGKDFCPVSVWQNIYKNEIIKKYNLTFHEILSEDIFFNLDYFNFVKKVAYIDLANYCYRKEGQASITGTFSEKKQARYKDFIVQLMKKAQGESNDECVLRVKSQAVARCRSYTKLINSSGCSLKDGKKYLKEFVEDEEIKKCWEDFSMDNLPIQQRIFHWCILHKFYGLALSLIKMKK